MKDVSHFRALWKNLAAKKQLTDVDMARLCIFRALISKKNDKVELAKHLLHKTFTPKTRPGPLNNGRTPFDAAETAIRYSRIHGDKDLFFGQPARELFLQEEIDAFNDLVKVLGSKGRLIRKYAYFFTRQDIFPEYQAVQTAHAAMELGAKIGWEKTKGVYFTVCGVPDVQGLEEVESLLKSLKHEYTAFREPDIGNQITSIGVHPIPEHKRGVLRNYNLLRFNREA